MNACTTLRVAMTVALFAALTACDRDATAQAQRSGERAGQKIDNAIDRTQKKLAEAGDKTQQRLSEAGDRMQPKLAEAGERISSAGERVAANVRDAVAPRGGTTTTVTTGPSTSITGLPADVRNSLGDTAITASIKADFIKDPGLSVLKIDVDTRDGVVTLNGLADDEAARQRAAQLAGAIKGVKEVRNHLTVKRT